MILFAIFLYFFSSFFSLFFFSFFFSSSSFSPSKNIYKNFFSVLFCFDILRKSAQGNFSHTLSRLCIATNNGQVPGGEFQIIADPVIRLSSHVESAILTDAILNFSCFQQPGCQPRIITNITPKPARAARDRGHRRQTLLTFNATTEGDVSEVPI